MFLSSACCAGGHNYIYQELLQTLDIHFRKFCRSIVGAPYIDWTLASCNFPVWNERAAHVVHTAKIGSPETVVVPLGNLRLILLNVPFTTGYEEFGIGNPSGKGGSGVQNCVGRANWTCIVVTKDWFIGRWQHRTTFLLPMSMQ